MALVFSYILRAMEQVQFFYAPSLYADCTPMRKEWSPPSCSTFSDRRQSAIVGTLQQEIARQWSTFCRSSAGANEQPATWQKCGDQQGRLQWHCWSHTLHNKTSV